MRERSRYFAFSAVAIVLAAGLLLGGCKPATDTDKDTKEETKAPYKIGVVISLTGPYAGLGEPEKAALEMERDRINAAGGVNGHPIELILEDDATDEAKATAAAAKLIGQDKVVALIGATGTGQTMAMRGDVDKAGVPQVSMAGGTAITAKFDPLVFATPWSNLIVIPYEFKYMQAKGIKKVGIISDSGGFGKDGVAVAKAEAGKYGIEIVSEQTFNAKDPDMSTQLSKIKDAGADAILLINAGSDAATVAKNRTSLKIDMPLYGTHGNARTEFIEGSGAAAEGFTFAAGKVLVPEAYGEGSSGYTVATDFIDRFTAKTGKAPSTFAGHAYDALYIITNAMSALPEGFTSAQLRDEIEKTQGFVGIGGTFNFSATDHNGLAESDLVMYTVENGTWKVVE